MLICVAAEQRRVCAHFGHCGEFALFEAEGGEVKLCKHMPNPGHAPGTLPPILKEWGVTHVIAGGMGNRAVALFQSMGIEVVTGAQGELEEVVRAFVHGDLITEENICDHSGEHGAGRCH